MVYKLIPIPGMEYTQKNFVYLKNYSTNVAFNMTNKPFLTLHERFQLLERGYTLKYTGTETNEEPEHTVRLTI